MTPQCAVPLYPATTSQRSERPLARPRSKFDRKHAAAVVAAFILCSPAIAAAQGASTRPMLLSTPAATRAASASSQTPAAERGVAKQRSVNVDFSALDPQTRNAPAQIEVELFDGKVVTLERERVEPRGRGNYTWYGKIQGQDTGQAILTVVKGKIAGSITLFDSGLRS